MRDRHVGSVVVDRRRRARDRHPHRTRHDPHRRGRLRRVERQGVGVDDRRSRHDRPRHRGARRLRDPVGARLPAHPRRRQTAAGRHRLDARPHAHRDDPARRGPGARGAEGSRRRRRRRDDRRRRPRPRRLLPLPPVQRGRPRAQSPARRRLAPPVRRRAAGDGGRARRVRRRQSASRRDIPDAVLDVLPAIAHAGETVRAARRAAHRDLAVRRDARLPVVDRRRRGDALRERDVDLRGGADADRGALASRPRRASRSHRATTSATPPTTST